MFGKRNDIVCDHVVYFTYMMLFEVVCKHLHVGELIQLNMCLSILYIHKHSIGDWLTNVPS